MCATTRTSRLAAVLVLLLATRAAQAGGFDDAYQKGQELFHLARYEEARAAFLRARSLGPKLPGPHRWLGRTARVLEQWEDCVASSTEAIRLRPDTPLLTQVRTDLDACRAALGRPPYPARLAAGQGALAVLSDVAEGRVLVDDIERGALPLDPFPLNAGRHVVRLAPETSLHLPARGPPTIQITVDVVPGIVVDGLLLTGRAAGR